VVPATAAFLFWLYCGEPAFIDRAILAELCLLAAGSWVLTLGALAREGHWRGAAPGRVVELVERLGARAVVPLVVAPALLVACGRLGLAGLEELHHDLGQGIAMLTAAWLAALFLGTFFFRLLGLWSYRARPAT
jgi:hypothetical protein